MATHIVRRTSAFNARVKDLGGQRYLARELALIYWAVSENPDIYERIAGTTLYALKMNPVPGRPGYRVLYEIVDCGVVELLSIGAYLPNQKQ